MDAGGYGAQLQRDSLTQRQMRLLVVLATGATQAQIARELSMSLATLKRELAEVQKKMGVSNRVQAIVEAVRRGYV